MKNTIIPFLPRRKNFMRGRYSLEIGYPWLTYGAIIQLELLSSPTWKVLELGSGGSTIFFSKRFGSVLSLDMNPDWTERVKEKLPESNNVTCLSGTFEYLMGIINELPDEYCDICLVDIGPHDKVRLALGEASIPKIRIGGYLVVDNYDTKRMNKFNYGGFDVFNFDDLDWSGRGTRICIKRYEYAKH